MSDLGTLVLLEINDLKSIDVVEIKMDEGGQLLRLKGNNGVGKSTVMEAIETLFNGGKMPKGLIRDGKKEALIVGKFSSGYKAIRKIRKKNNGEETASIEVLRPDGGKVSSPQSVLKEIFAGYMTPSRLAGMTGVSLYDEIVKQLPIDLESMETDINQAVEERREFDAHFKILGEADKPEGEKPETMEPFDQKAFQDLADYLSNSRTLDAEINRLLGDVEEARDLINRKKDEITANQSTISKYTENLINLPEKTEQYEAMRKQMNDFQTNSERIRDWQIFDEKVKIKAGLETKKESILEKIKLLREKMRETIAASTKVDGMTLTEERGVQLNGKEWETCAFSERVLAAAILQIKCLPEGKLPIMFIEHGEAMNMEKQTEIARTAINQGALVFMEVMDEGIDKLTIESEAVVGDWMKPPKENEIPEEPAKKANETPSVQSVPPIPGMIPASELPTAYDDSELDIF